MPVCSASTEQKTRMVPCMFILKPEIINKRINMAIICRPIASDCVNVRSGHSYRKMLLAKAICIKCSITTQHRLSIKMVRFFRCAILNRKVFKTKASMFAQTTQMRLRTHGHCCQVLCY